MIKIIEKARKLWYEVTGTDVNAHSIRLGNWELYKANEEINYALTTFKDGGLTGLLLMDAFVEDYLSDRSIAVNKFLRDYEGSMKYLNLCHELYQTLRCEELEDLRQQFKENVLNGLKHYGYDREDVVATVEDRHELAFLRLSALRSMETLRPHQFTQGKPDSARPAYVETVFEWWNVNSLIRGLAMMPASGVTLNLIHDPNGLFSYFVFGMRNGGTTTVLTDKPEYSHPLQKHMSRRPDKSFDKRYRANWFPYDLLKFERDPDGNPYMKQAQEERRLTLYQTTSHPIGKIGDLSPPEIIWTVMMFDLIVDRFWRENLLLPNLSYTVDMMKCPTVLLDAPEMKALALQEYKPIEVPELNHDIVSKEAMAEQCVRQTGQHDWMEDRYGDRADKKLLNILPGDNATRYISEGDFEVKEATTVEEKYLATWNKLPCSDTPRYIVQTFDPCEFGTENALQKDRLWLARYNKTKAIQSAANEEFSSKREEVLGDYVTRVKSNVPTLLKAIAAGEFRTDGQGHKDFDYPTFSGVNILTIFDTDDKETRADLSYGYGPWGHVALHKGEKGNRYACYLDGTRSTYLCLFQPTTAKALADLCGCDVSDLPVFLQHWSKHERYAGNSILQRLDPLEWAVKNPWRDLPVNIYMYLSKRAMSRIKKEFCGK